MIFDPPRGDRMRVLAAELLVELRRIELMAKAANIDPTKTQVLTVCMALHSYCIEQLRLLRLDVAPAEKFKQ